MSEIIKKRWPLILVGVFFIVLIGTFVWKSNIKETEVDWVSTDKLTLTETEKAKYEETVVKLEQNQKDPEALVNLARLRNYGGDLEGAIKIYLEALKLRPNDTLILNNLGDAYYSLGDYKKSEEMYLKIIENNPKWISAYRELVNIYHYKLKDKYTTVPALLERGLSADPGSSEDFYALLGIYYEDVGDIANAILYYEKVLAINPQNIGARSALDALRPVKF
ncbi:MAG: tetratricopeptide repeat protein [Patescibacteria group bacterium]|jgi:tetratricopeptide (TPR) repeat protein